MHLFKNQALIFGIATALSASPFAYIESTHTGTSAKSYIDFAASSPVSGHSAWETWTTPNGNQNARYYNIELFSGAGKCFLIRFTAGATPAGSADLRLWTNAGVSIDDDGPGTVLPQARVWTSSSIRVTVSAYSSNYNAIDAWQSVESVAAASASACDDGSLPFYNYDAGTILRADAISN